MFLARLLSIHLVPPVAGLRRSVQGSAFPSTFASQFTQGEAKGRTFAYWFTLSLKEIQKPLFSMGLDGCKDNTLINSTFLCYPLNFCVHNSQSHLLSRMISTTYLDPSKNILWIHKYINISISASIAYHAFPHPSNSIFGYI